MPARDVIVCDLDGTLACDNHRQHLLKVEPKQWEDYFSLCGGDDLVQAVAALVNMAYYSGKTVVILSARCESVRNKTIVWLNKHGVMYDNLIMRPLDNRETDAELKLQMLRDAGYWDRVLFVLEDRQRVVDAWRAAGIACFQVRPGDF